MRRALLVLTTALLLAAIAAVAFWPDRGAVEPAASAGQEDGEACTSCTLRHQRLGEPAE